MRLSRRTIAIGSCSAAAAAGVAVAAVLLTGNSSPAKGGHLPQAAQAAVPLVSPFTGEPVSTLGPVLAVKIDNIVLARPQTGLTKADIVYLIPVEGGLSRFLAVFSSHFPPVIGPVRSAREDDLQLLRQFGTPAFAFSGAQPQLLPVVEHARIVDLYDGRVGGYYRGPNRVAPYNLFASTKQLLAEAPHASRAHDIGFRFGRAPAGGQPAASYSVSYRAASFAFRWSAKQARWLVWMDGAPAASAEDGQLGAPTVVIQYTKVGTSSYREAGKRPPYAATVGSGRAVVLRNGRSYAGHWSRPQADGGTTFTTAAGQPLTFARGQVWVVLAYGPGSTG
jgi:Protein of unknown function (DUF3048) N-terminal domain/Protein of unknown function (DUF3048) C-terminal domain